MTYRFNQRPIWACIGQLVIHSVCLQSSRYSKINKWSIKKNFKSWDVWFGPFWNFISWKQSELQHICGNALGRTACIHGGPPLVLWPPLSRKPYELDQISLNTTVGDYIRNPLKKIWLFRKFWFWSNFKPLYLGNNNNHTKSFLYYIQRH